MKKILKITGIVLLSLLLILLILPFAFKGKVAGIIQEQANKNLQAKVAFSDLSLSFFKNFPKVTASLENLTIAGVDAFEGDTLLSAKEISVAVNLTSLFSDEGISVKRIELVSPKILAKVLADGRANWDITKPDSLPEKEDESSFVMQLEDVEIINGYVTYIDEEGGMTAKLADWNGNFNGDLSAAKSVLKTKSVVTSLSYSMGKLPVLVDVKLEGDMEIQADMNTSTYTFLNNKLKLNAVEASLDGWVQMPDTTKMVMDLKLNTDKVAFKDLLSLLPGLYAADFKDMKTSGNLTMAATVKGTMEGENYPAFDVKLAVDKGMFQYPSLPKSVTDININSHISSKGGSLDNTIVDISKFHFNMGGNPFDITAYVATPISDPNVKGTMGGKLNLGMVREVYPLEKGTELQGEIDANISAAGRMSYMEKGQYEKFTANGTLAVKGINYKSADMPEVAVKEVRMNFSPKEVALTAFSMMIGKNDIQATGKLTNLLPYLMKDGILQGKLDITSSYLNINDFMKEDSTAAKADSVPMLAFEIPKNLDFNMSASGNEIVYDKLSMKNVKGNLTVKNGRITINNLSANAMGGKIGLNGYYEAINPKKPEVSFGLDLQTVSFSETFRTLDMAKSLAPIFENMQGNYSMKLNFNSALTEHMEPILSSLTGAGNLNSNSVKVSDVKALTLLASTLKNDALANLSPKDLNIPFSIGDGRVKTSPFTIQLGDTKLNLSGSTGIDKTIDYALKVTLPANLARNGITSLEGTIGGTFTSPKIKLDAGALAKQAVAGLADKLLGKTVTDSSGAQTQISAKENMTAKAEEIRASAKAAGDKLIAEAEKQGALLVEKAKNPLLKAGAQATAKKLKSEAEKKAAAINAQAEEQIKQLQGDK